MFDAEKMTAGLTRPRLKCVPGALPHLAKAAFAENLDEVEVRRTISAPVRSALARLTISFNCFAVIFLTGQHLNGTSTILGLEMFVIDFVPVSSVIS